MSEIVSGTLFFKKRKDGTLAGWNLKGVNHNGKSLDRINVQKPQISADLLNELTAETSVDYEFDDANNVVRVRKSGGEWTASNAVHPESNRGQNNAGGRHGGNNNWRGNRQNQPHQQNPRGGNAGARPNGEFHNPYNFIPAVLPTETGLLGQYKPVGHEKYYAELWNGKIRIKLTTKTPLLLADPARVKTNENGHDLFPISMVDGKPHFPPTSVKGVIRSGFEAITNSRMGVLEKHDKRLAYRSGAQAGAEGARVVDEKTIEVFSEAAWLPRGYNRRGGRPVNYKGTNENPVHGDRVVCWVQKFKHDRRNFTFWRVIEITKGDNFACLSANPPGYGNTNYDPIGEPKKAHGWVCITNNNFDRKHDERVFLFDDGFGSPQKMPLTPELKNNWKTLIENYHETAKNHNNGSIPTSGQISRHVRNASSEKNLSAGDLLYVQTSGNAVKGVFPVMLSRELSPSTPIELLSEKLHPAKQLDELSPADRVFGWVNQNGKGNYKGQLRIGSVICNSKDPVCYFHSDSSDGEEGLPLAILSTPKPQQARFYAAKDQRTVEAQPCKQTKPQAAYGPGKGLRGRKVYPHHRLTAEHAAYWDGPKAFIDSQNGQVGEVEIDGKNVAREYIRQGNNPDNRDKQNRSVTGWVKPDTEYDTWIEVSNLNQAELGALIWMLSLPDDHYLRFGGGKPLGFGSAHVNITSLDLVSGEGRKKQFSNIKCLLDDQREKNEFVTEVEQATEKFVPVFKKAIEEGYGTEFEKTPFIVAYLVAAKGHEKHVHYPRANAQLTEETNIFEWFVNNERHPERMNNQAGTSLDNLADDSGLPYFTGD